MSALRPLLPALAAAAVVSGCTGAEPPPVALAAGFASWEAASLADGRPLRFEARDGPVVLNVWATWCEPCRREMASLEAAHGRLASSGIRVVGVNVDRDVLLAREYVRRMRLTFPNVSDPGQAVVAERLGVKRLPTTAGIGADGTVRWRDEAARDWSEPARLDWVARSLGGR